MDWHTMTDVLSFPHRLAAATTAHDIEALVACFGADYINETPAHPARGFLGADQVRRNWTQLFAGIPDDTDFYFVHSYAFVPDESSDVLATINYGVPLTAAVRRGRIWRRRAIGSRL